MNDLAKPIRWPDGKTFAFTIIDDTDGSTVENTKPVYSILAEHGLRTTKTVWPFRPTEKAITGGDTLENPSYRNWILELQASGFEIALHGVSDDSSRRERVLKGFESYKRNLGTDPTIHVNHAGQAEALYWGPERFDAPIRWMYGAYRRMRSSMSYAGIDRSSPFFWGDICRDRIKYVRNFAFPDINTLAMDPFMPYHDPRRPYVRYWFSCSYGSGVDTFCNLISEAQQDKLMREGGACIVYTHLGSTFYPVQDRFKRLIRRIASMPGWFVPVTTLLDYLGSQRGCCNIAEHRWAFQRMQWNWLLQQAIGGKVPKLTRSRGAGEPLDQVSASA